MINEAKYFIGVDPINPKANGVGAITVMKKVKDSFEVVNCHVFRGRHKFYERLKYNFLIWKYSKFYGKVLKEGNDFSRPMKFKTTYPSLWKS